MRLPVAGGGISQMSKPLRIGDAVAKLAHALGVVTVLVGVEASDQAPAMRVVVALERIGAHAHARHRLAGEVERDHGELQALLARGPAVRLDAEHDLRRPQRDARGGGQRLAVGVAILELGEEVARLVGALDVLDGRPRAPARIERQRQVGAAFGSRRAAGVAFREVGIGERVAVEATQHVALLLAPDLDVAAGKAVVVVVGKAHGLAVDLRAQHDGQPAGAAAGQIAHLEVDVDLARIDERRSDRLQARAQERHAERFDAKAFRPGAPAFPSSPRPACR